MMFFLLFACDSDLLSTTGELGRLNYTLDANYNVGGIRLDEAKLSTGYPQQISATLTLAGWKMVETEPYMVYHSSPDPISLNAETLLDGAIGVPSFTIETNTPGTYFVESKKEDELIDQIHLQFVQPDAISVLSWVREPSSEEFVLFDEENISVQLGSQAAFVPIPMFEGERVVGSVDVEISVEPPEAAVIGYNIENVTEDGVSYNASPASIYFMQEGTIMIGATDVVNDVTTHQRFTVVSQ
jgi:predicted RNA binding protein with dsRBD fold (UPF0201 family)